MARGKREEKQKDKKRPEMGTSGGTGFRSWAGGSTGTSIKSPGCRQADSVNTGTCITSARSNSSGSTHAGSGPSLAPRASLLSFVAVAASAVFLPGRTPFWKFAAVLALLISINYFINRQPGKLMRKLLHLLLFLLPFFIFLLLVTLLFSGK